MPVVNPFKRCSVLAWLVWLSVWISSTASAMPVPAPPQLSASSYLLVDHISGKVLAEKNADERAEPASLTKLMTAYLVMEELDQGSAAMNEPVVVSSFAQSMPGSRMFIEAGKAVSVGELLQGLVVQSGNDASVALAEHFGGSEANFVQMMNAKAAELGMSNTHYMNSSGLPHPEHYTTARDLGLIARAIIKNFPDYYRLYSQKEFTWNEITQENRNTLLWRDDSVDGMKTGHTDSAGYCLVSSAVRDSMRLISVVLGTVSDKTRIAESQQLLNYGFRFFRTERIFTAGEVISEAPIWMGREESIALGVEQDLYVTLPRDAFEKLTNQILVSDYIRAPAHIGQEFGRTVLFADDEKVIEVPLLSLQNVDQAGLFRRMKHSIMRHFQ